MFHYELLSNFSFPVNEKIIQKILTEIEILVSKKQNGTINIIGVNDEEIQYYNKTYRQIDAITDVLSFHYFDEYFGLKKEDIAGEIILCESKVISQGIEYGLGSEYEFYKLLIHSILHLLGYDHETDEEYRIMNEIEKKIYEKILEN